MIRFVLVGPNAGKTIGLSRTHTGKHRFNFVEGVMEIHESRVNGRFISLMAGTYGAHIDGKAPAPVGDADGISDVQPSGDNLSGSEDLSSKLAEGQPSPASESAIELKGSASPKGGSKKQSA